MTTITLGLLIYARPNWKNLVPIAILILIVIIISIALTWYPYFQNVALGQVLNYKKTRLGLVGAFQAIWNGFWNIPSYVTFQWADYSTLDLTIKHASPRLLSHAALFLLKLSERTYLAQAVFSFTTFAFFVASIFWEASSGNKFAIKINKSSMRLVILAGLFTGLSYSFSIWFGGPAWIEGEQADQTVQFLPMFLLIIFLLPTLVIMDNRVGKLITWISHMLLLVFGVINFMCGVLIVRDHLNYRGDVLTEADVPLVDKARVVAFVANDWKKYSSSNMIPVDYRIGGKEWDDVPEFGTKLLPWYPAPMTQGRSFDYELLRQYGLTNQQEGIQLRTFGTGRYLITYAFEDPPIIENKSLTHYIFGRLRVSIAE